MTPRSILRTTLYMYLRLDPGVRSTCRRWRDIVRRALGGLWCLACSSFHQSNWNTVDLQHPYVVMLLYQFAAEVLREGKLTCL